MKKLLLFIFLCSSGVFLFGQLSKTDSDYSFYENRGQIVDQKGKENSAVKYLFHSKGLNVQLKSEGFAYDVYELKKTLKKTSKKKQKTFLGENSDRAKYDFEFQFHRVDIDFIGANKNPIIIAEGKSEDYENFYNVPNKPHGVEKVYRYEKITYKNLYANIDLVFFKPDDTLKPIEYNFIVNPGGKISDIQLRFNGAKTKLKDGKLSMKLRFGEMQENIPHSWTEDQDKKIAVDVSFKNLGKQVFGFQSSKDIFDKTMVIDPVPALLWIKNLPNLSHSTNENYRIIADNSQNIYTSFNTLARYDLATNTHNLFDTGAIDYGYVSKFDSSGNKIWGTFIGNHHSQMGFSFLNMLKDMVIDSSKNLYLVGHAADSMDGTNTITTPGAHKEHSTKSNQYYAFENVDSYIMKLNNKGLRVWGTYYGGSSYDTINSAFIDSEENLVIAGQTVSNQGIATADGAQTTNTNPYNGISFIAKFSKNGQQIYGSYFKVRDGILKIAGDSQDNIYFTADVFRNYNTLDTLVNWTHQQNMSGDANVYLAKMDRNFQLQWQTYFGGRDIDGVNNNTEEGRTRLIDFKIDHNDDLIFVGSTGAVEKIATSGTHQSTFDLQYAPYIFMTKFDSNGNQKWGTYFGGRSTNNNGYHEADAISIDEENNIFLSGQSTRKFDIATPGAFLQDTGGGYNSGFFTKFSTVGTQIWGSYFYRVINSIFVKEKNIYTLGGVALVNNFAKFYDCTAAISTTSNSPVCIGETVQLSASGGSSYSWTGPNGYTSTDQNPTIPNATAAMAGIYSCVILGTGACDGTFTVEVKVEDKTAPVPNVVNLPLITGNCKTIISTIPTATDNCTGNIVGTTSDPLQYSLPGNYIIHWKFDDGNGNISTQNQNVTFVSEPLPTGDPDQNFCLIDAPKISDIQISGIDIKFYDAVGNRLNSNTLLIDGTKYFATQTLNGCESAKTEILVHVNDPTAPTGNATQDFCSAQNPTIGNIVVVGQNIKWFDASGNILPTTTPLLDGKTYYATQTVNGCESTQKLGITVKVTNGGILANDFSASFCNDTTGNTKTDDLNNYKANLIADPANYNFEFFNANNQVISNPGNVNLNIGSNIFNVKISNSLGCFIYVKLTLTLNQKPILNLPTEVEFCNGQSATLDAGSGFASYEWTNDNSPTVLSTQQILVVTEAGIYSIKVKNSFCENTASIRVTQSVIANIVAIQIINNTATVQMSAAGDFEYSLDNTAWQDSNIFKNLKNGNYTVFVKTKLGCIIGAMNFSIFSIPNAFSPNADGRNDTWKISGLENYPGSEIQVFDRFGSVVLQKITNGPFEWDGFSNSRVLPTGNYWYVVKVSDGRLLKGWVLIKNRD